MWEVVVWYAYFAPHIADKLGLLVEYQRGDRATLRLIRERGAWFVNYYQLAREGVSFSFVAMLPERVSDAYLKD